MTSRRPGAPRSARRPVAASSGNRRSTSASRPAQSARPRTTAPSEAEADGPVITITRHTLILIVVIVLCLSALVPVVNSYVAQQQQLRSLQQQVEQQQEDVTALEAQVKRWEDPAFVAAQARERLLYAMPGETQYRLTDTSGREVPQSEQQQAAAEAAKDDWNVMLWESVEGSSRIQPEDIPSTQKESE